MIPLVTVDEYSNISLLIGVAVLPAKPLGVSTAVRMVHVSVSVGVMKGFTWLIDCAAIVASVMLGVDVVVVVAVLFTICFRMDVNAVFVRVWVVVRVRNAMAVVVPVVVFVET